MTIKEIFVVIFQPDLVAQPEVCVACVSPRIVSATKARARWIKSYFFLYLKKVVSSCASHTREGLTTKFLVFCLPLRQNTILNSLPTKIEHFNIHRVYIAVEDFFFLFLLVCLLHRRDLFYVCFDFVFAVWFGVVVRWYDSLWMYFEMLVLVTWNSFIHIWILIGNTLASFCVEVL